MLIGIMSGAHDRIQGVRDALRVFSEQGVDIILFAGDMIGSGNCYIFEALGISIKLVYGNNDANLAGLASEFSSRRGEYSQIYDVVVRGHNHRAEATRSGKTLLVNPGEIWGYLTGLCSVAVKRMKMA